MPNQFSIVKIVGLVALFKKLYNFYIDVDNQNDDMDILIFDFNVDLDLLHIILNESDFVLVKMEVETQENLYKDLTSVGNHFDETYRNYFQSNEYTANLQCQILHKHVLPTINEIK